MLFPRRMYSSEPKIFECYQFSITIPIPIRDCRLPPRSRWELRSPGTYATSSGNCLPTFRNNLSVPSSRVIHLFLYEVRLQFKNKKHGSYVKENSLNLKNTNRLTQFNVISEVYFENCTTTAINSSYSYKIGCRMETVRRSFEVPQHDSKDQYAGWTSGLLDFLTSPSSDTPSRASKTFRKNKRRFFSQEVPSILCYFSSKW
jgi:hypothetical protein